MQSILYMELFFIITSAVKIGVKKALSEGKDDIIKEFNLRNSKQPEDESNQ